MAEEKAATIPSLVIRSLLKSGKLFNLAGVAGLPGASAIGAGLIAIPEKEAEEWINRMWQIITRNRRTTSEAIAKEPAAIPNDIPPPAEISPADRTKAAAFIVSEPFQIAVDEAITSFQIVLAEFLNRTLIFNRSVGVWPSFALEEIARRHFKKELGGSAAAQNPEVAALIETGLARDMIETIHGSIAAPSQPPGYRVTEKTSSTRLWTHNLEHAWPGIGDLMPGYFVGYRTSGTESLWDPEPLEKERQTLLARLGKMGIRELEYLSEKWLEVCRETGRIGPTKEGLSQFQINHITAVATLERGGASSEDLQQLGTALELMLETTRRMPENSRENIDAGNSIIANATAGKRREFENSVKDLSNGLMVNEILNKSDETSRVSIENAITMLRTLRGW